MKISVQLPPQEQIDFNRKCYAFVVFGVAEYNVLQVGLSEDEVRQNIQEKFKDLKSTYKAKRLRYLLQANTKELVPDKFHRGIQYQIVECDMKFYLYFKDREQKKINRRVKFIFDRLNPPYSIKYAR